MLGRELYYRQSAGIFLILCQVYQTVNWKRPKQGTEAKNVALLWYDQQSL